MRGHANADELAPGGHSRGNCRLLRQQDGQRARPELIHERIDFLLHVSGSANRNLRQHVAVGDVDDHGIPGGPLLGEKNLLHGGWIERIRAQAIDRLRWKRHGTAGANDFRSLLERGLRGYRRARLSRNRQPNCTVCGHEGLRGLRAQRKPSVFHPNLSNV